MSEWQSIETAPKDGTKILVSASRGVFIVEWNGPGIESEARCNSTAYMDWWWIDNSERDLTPLRGMAPLWWQPLPLAMEDES